jgi:hypothetical protein
MPQTKLGHITSSVLNSREPIKHKVLSSLLSATGKPFSYLEQLKVSGRLVNPEEFF